MCTRLRGVGALLLSPPPFFFLFTPSASCVHHVGSEPGSIIPARKSHPGDGRGRHASGNMVIYFWPPFSLESILQPQFAPGKPGSSPLPRPRVLLMYYTGGATGFKYLAGLAVVSVGPGTSGPLACVPTDV